MNPRAFSLLDLDEMNRWYERRGEAPIPASMLPRLGLIVPGVAVGFLYQTDSSVALVEGLVTNPDAKLCDRAKALQIILEELVESARVFGFKQVIGFGASRGPVRLTLRQGFRCLGAYEMVMKEVS